MRTLFFIKIIWFQKYLTPVGSTFLVSTRKVVVPDTFTIFALYTISYAQTMELLNYR